MKKYLYLLVGVSAFMPVAAFAQATNTLGLASAFTTFVDYIYPAFMALVLIFFAIAVIRWIRAKGDDERKQAGRSVAYGLIGVIILFSIFGIVRWVGNETGVGENTVIDVPQPNL
jgi:predicted PurR-regulated permease PerM